MISMNVWTPKFLLIGGNWGKNFDIVVFNSKINVFLFENQLKLRAQIGIHFI